MKKRNSINRKCEYIDLYQCVCGSFYKVHLSTKGIGKSKHQWDFVGCPVLPDENNDNTDR